MEEKAEQSQQTYKICPKCGYRPKDEHDPLTSGECPACGVIISKYFETLVKKAEAGASPDELKVYKVSDKPEKLSHAGLTLILFGVLFLISSCVLNTSSGTMVLRLTPDGGMVGPIEVTKNRTVYQIDVGQNIVKDNEWSYVSGEVLDKNQNHLFGFGKEFWKESGYDSEGRWTERVRDYKMKVTLSKGIYYLWFESEKSANVRNDIYIRVHKKLGSSLPFLIAGIVILIIGLVVNEVANQSVTKILSALDDS
ncbi:hypothetical protein ACFL9U_09510 [Thermodesulfobacteriota bacterium]